MNPPLQGGGSQRARASPDSMRLPTHRKQQARPVPLAWRERLFLCMPRAVEPAGLAGPAHPPTRQAFPQSFESRSVHR